MQIHEITLAKQLTEAGPSIKDAMMQAALKGSPGMGSLYTTPGRADARLQAQTAKYVKDLSREWINYASSAKLDQLSEADVDPRGKVPFEQLPPGVQQQVLAKEKGAQPAASTGGDIAYKNAFKAWAEQKLQTTETKTGRQITLDNVESLPGMKGKLDQAFGKMLQARQNPAKLESAVTEYLTLAVTGTQQVAKSIRQRAGISGGTAHPPITIGTGPQAIVYIHNGQKYVNARNGQPLDPNLVKPGA
jgi:hypothetical protein